MPVAILRQGDYLIASIQSDLTDSQVLALRDELAERVGRVRARGLIVDVAALDVIDSFVARALRSIAVTARLAGRGDDHRRHPAGRRDRDGAVQPRTWSRCAPRSTSTRRSPALDRLTHHEGGPDGR